MCIKQICHWLLVILSITVLISCQNTVYQASIIPAKDLLVADEQFANLTNTPLHNIETASEIFMLPNEAKIKLHKLIKSYHSLPERTEAVLDFIVSYADDGLIYDNSATRTASETLQHSKANCLSLSILAYSLAREVGMNATFQDVKIPEYWTSQLNQTWLNGHVNLRLKHHRQLEDGIGVVLLGSDFVVDFDPYSLKKRFSSIPITEQRVVAMFYNNKAAVAYAEQNYAQAYAYYKAAINTDSQFAVTWSNLGVLYRVHHLHDLAEKAYNHSLALAPDSTNTLSNLAYLYKLQGKEDLANQLERQVIKQRENNPYYYLMLGTEAYNQQDFRLAIKHFEKSLALESDNHEAYFGLAKIYFSLNQLAQAERYLSKAQRHTFTKQDKQRYQKKLAVLNKIAKSNS
jgi:Flp pilus assembly protein TadD